MTVVTTVAATMPTALAPRHLAMAINTSATIPTARAAGMVSPASTPVMKPRASATKPSASTENPNSFGSWPTMTVRAMPLRYPIRMGLDSRSVSSPRWSSPKATPKAPAMRARPPARATA